jgi:hypothetical protein
MEKIEVPVDEVKSVQALSPHMAVIALRTIAGQDVVVHIRPKELRQLLDRLSDIAKEFPAETSEQNDE